MKERLTLLGRTTFRNQRRPFGISDTDRRHHIYVIGQTGTGKSTLLDAIMRQDLVAGRGFALVDPHGDLVDAALVRFPGGRQETLTYFNLPDPSAHFSFNPLWCTPATRGIAAAAVLDVFRKIWSESWGPRLEHVLRYALLALVELPQSTIADVLRLLDDDEYRRDVARQVENVQVRRFWLREYERYSPGRRAEAIAPVQNKVGAFLGHPRMRQAIASTEPPADLRRIMDESGLLLVNLSKGRVGDDAAALFGALLTSTLARVGLERADQPAEERRDFTLYLDEFHTLLTPTLSTMLSELRKYRLSLVLAHQYLAQLDPGIRDAILGNIGTIVTFRVGPSDAKVLAPVLGNGLTPADLMNLPNHHAYVRLLVDGTPIPAFSAETLRL